MIVGPFVDKLASSKWIMEWEVRACVPPRACVVCVCCGRCAGCGMHRGSTRETDHGSKLV